MQLKKERKNMLDNNKIIFTTCLLPTIKTNGNECACCTNTQVASNYECCSYVRHLNCYVHVCVCKYVYTHANTCPSLFAHKCGRVRKQQSASSGFGFDGVIQCFYSICIFVWKSNCTFYDMQLAEKIKN